MQPFGLFSLLQTLMNAQLPTPQASNTEPKSVDNETENTPLVQEENVVSQENRQAFLHFLQAHDSRVQRTKKR